MANRTPPPPPVVGVGAVALDGDGRLLVVQRARPPAAGRWTLPGGRVEAGEELRTALAREVREETGYEVEVGALIGVAERIARDHHLVIVDFAARVTGGALRAGDDAAEAAWLPRSELRRRELTDGLLEFLDEHGVALAE